MSSALAAVSPHLDDLALSCANLLAVHPGSSLVTVFAGGPSSVDPVTGWEALSGRVRSRSGHRRGQAGRGRQSGSSARQ